jgi:hypothetical protein
MLRDYMVPLSLRRIANLATKAPRHGPWVIEPYRASPVSRAYGPAPVSRR